MKKQVKLTESELYKVIRESVKSLVTELGGTPSTRSAMAQAARRAINKGDDSVYHNAVNSITKGGGSKNDLIDFGKKFEIEDGTNLEEFTDFDKQKMFGPDYDEDFDDNFNEQPANVAAENKEAIKITESQLKDIVKETVKIILNKKTSVN